MADVRTFRALRPRDDLADRVIAPPYDVLSDLQCRVLAENRSCFVRVTRSEVDLPFGADAHGDAAYAMARTNLDALFAEGILVRDAEPTYYLYGQRMGDHEQVGVIAAASVEEYDRGEIAKHEFTRPDKEDDRTHHMDVIDAQVGLVFLTYEPTERLTVLVSELTVAKPAWKVTTEDGVVHTLWVVPHARCEEMHAAFQEVPKLYIADGHHRSAAASRVHARRQTDQSAYFLAGLYPADRLQVMAYNRVLGDLNGLSVEGFMAAVETRWEVSAGTSEPAERGEVSMYLEGRWLTLRLRDHLRSDDPVERLDAAALQTHLLEPVLGIQDPRRSKRISFVGGIHGSVALKAAVDQGAAVAFHLFPTGLDQLFVVADAGKVMPPKSTWFEPKLREGVAVRMLR
jgi:uncharacterized protein (DUF1015 family)